MLRVKDPAVSLAFYTRVFGMRVLRKLDFAEMKFSLYFLHRAQAGEAAPPDDEGERTAWTFAQRGILELTHNWGTEAQADFKSTTATRSRRASATSASRCPTSTPRSAGSTRTSSPTSSGPSRARCATWRS